MAFRENNYEEINDTKRLNKDVMDIVITKRERELKKKAIDVKRKVTGRWEKRAFLLVDWNGQANSTQCGSQITVYSCRG